MTIEILLTHAATAPSTIAAHLADPGRAACFTDHMVVMEWDAHRGWHSARVQPYGPFLLDPSAGVFQQETEFFDALHAYRHGDGSVWTFRPRLAAARLNAAASRAWMPELPGSLFLAATDSLIAADLHWVPEARGNRALQLRPFMFSTQSHRDALQPRDVTLAIIATPTGPDSTQEDRPTAIHVRGRDAPADEFSVGGRVRDFNKGLSDRSLFFVRADGMVVAPASTNTLPHGVAHTSVLELLRFWGINVAERRVDLDEWWNGITSGQITEVFACDTDGLISTVGRLERAKNELEWARDAGALAQRLQSALTEVRHGYATDTMGWLHQAT